MTSSSPCTAAPTHAPVPTFLPAAGRRQGTTVLGVLVAVAVADQATKWWAWRHIAAVLNHGSTWFLGGTVSSWCSAPVSGALLDLAGVQVLALALFALLRRRRPLQLLLPALLVIGGWASNLLDRLGLHLLTAPGMGRGAVDFVHLGGCYCNIADLCIAVGTLLLGLVLYRRRGSRGGECGGERVADRGARRPVTGGPLPRPWRGARRWVVLAGLAPALLGTVATVTASGGHVTPAATPLIGVLNGVLNGGGTVQESPSTGQN